MLLFFFYDVYDDDDVINIGGDFDIVDVDDVGDVVDGDEIVGLVDVIFCFFC